jgi:hypothetical protein
MKVKIMQRQVFYKYAELEIELPNDWNNKDGVEDYYYDHLNDYLHDNENLWCDKLCLNLDKANYEEGFGMHEGNFTDHTEENEWRYEVNGNGGHL